MDDPELDAIRRARMAELQASRGGSSGGGGAGRGSGAGGGVSLGGAGGMGEDSAKQQQEMEAQDEMKRQALSTILDSEARERLSRIALVKPSKARAIQDLLIRMAQSGQVRQKITEQQLIGLLDQVEGQGQAGSGGSGGAGKITYTRKKTLSDDEDDFDL